MSPRTNQGVKTRARMARTKTARAPRRTTVQRGPVSAVFAQQTPATRSPSPVSSLGSKSQARPPLLEGPDDSVGVNSAPPSLSSVLPCGAVDVRTPSMSENIMGILEQSNADTSTPAALQDWVLPVTWQPDDVHLQGVQITHVIDDAEFVSSSETAVFQFCVRHNLGVKACTFNLPICETMLSTARRMCTSTTDLHGT